MGENTGTRFKQGEAITTKNKKVADEAIMKQESILNGTDVLNTEIRAHEVRVDES